MGKPIFDISKPGVAVMRSSFGGGWVWPLTDEAVGILNKYFDEDPAPLAPLGGKLGWIVEPQDSGSLAEFLQDEGCAWVVK